MLKGELKLIAKKATSSGLWVHEMRNGTHTNNLIHVQTQVRVVLSSSPSDNRGHKNILSEMRRIERGTHPVFTIQASQRKNLAHKGK